MATPTLDAPSFDLFISYSRADEAFVRRLADALATQKRRAWVDWQGIPPSADWMREVYSAIEASDCFVFVLSKASLKSTVCADEVKHAVACRKRLIPVALGLIDHQLVTEDVRRPNWVVCHEPENFDTAFAALVQALDTDLDWVRDHTRLLVRAVEWRNGGHDASLALRGTELQRAEEWLAKASDREPKPSDLHSQFILTSRVEQVRRSRRMLTAVAAALVVAIGLAVVAWFQREEAVAQREQATTQRSAAEEQRNRAENNRLEADRQTVAALTNESTASLRQGLEIEALVAGLKAATKIESEVALQQPSVAFYRAAIALRQAVFGSHERNRFVTNEFRGVTHLAFTADDSGFYAAGGGGTIKRWTPAGQSISAFETEHHGTGDGCPSIANMALAKDGQTILTLGNEGTFAQWTSAGERTTSFDAAPYGGGDGQCSGIVWSTIDVDREIVTIRDWRSTFVRTLKGDTVETRLSDEPVDSDFEAADQRPLLSSTGQYEAHATSNGELLVTRRADGVEIMRLRNQRSPAFSHDEKRIATVSSALDTSIIHLWDLVSADVEIPPNIAGAGTRPAPQTRMLGSRSVELEQMASTKERAAVLSPAGDTAALVADVRKGSVELWRLQPQSNAPAHLVKVIDTDQIASADFAVVLDSLAFSPDGRTLATGGSDGTVKFWDSQGALKGQIVAHRVDARAIFSPDGILMATWGDNATGIEIKLWSLEGELLDTMIAPEWSSIRFSDDGQWVVATTPSETPGGAPTVKAWPLGLNVLVHAGCNLLRTYRANPTIKIEPELCR